MLKDKLLTNSIKCLILGLGILFIIIGFNVTINIETERLKNDVVTNIQRHSTILNTKFLKIEDAVNNLSYYITGSFELNQSRNKKYLANYSKTLNSVSKEFAKNTDENISTYFYFSPELTGGVYGVWIVDKKNNNIFVNCALESLSAFTPQNAYFYSWYYKPILAKKALWSDIYYDSELKMPMISYTKPVYKQGNLLGVVGMDISLKGLNGTIKNLSRLNSEELLLIDNKGSILASSNIKHKFFGGLTQNYQKKYIKNLEKTSRQNITGTIDAPANAHSKILAYSRLINNFILLSDTSLPNLIEKSVIQELIIIAIAVLLLILIDMFSVLSDKKS